MEARDALAQRHARKVTPIVDIDGLDKWFGDVHVLRNISISVGQGEKIVICGPSGSGKSTLLRCINGLEDHQQGRICVDGIELNDDMRSLDEIRRRVGMVFRQSNLFPHLTIMDNLLLGPMCTGDAARSALEARALELLERVHLADQRTKYPNQLSGGQQQRVAIARALMLRPKLLLFDEPTSALAPDMIAQVLDAMIELAEQEMTMLVVTAEMGFARTIADRIVFMDAGEIVETGAPSEFFNAPGHELERGPKSRTGCR